MKHTIYFLSLIIVMLCSSEALAAEEELLIKANAKGQVIVEAEKTQDGNEYVLHNAEPQEPYAVSTMSVTTFSTKHFSSGFFDKPTTGYTITASELYPGYADSTKTRVIDNKVPTQSTAAGGTGRYIKITFNTAINIEGFFLSANRGNIRFYNSAGTQIHYQNNNGTTQAGVYYTKTLNGVKSLQIDGVSADIYEVELFPIYQIDYVAASSFSSSVNEYTAEIQFKNPSSTHFRYNVIMLDGKTINSNTTATKFTLDKLEQDKSYEFVVRSYYSDGKYIDAIYQFRTKKDTTPPKNVSEIKAGQVNETIRIEWSAATDVDFSHYNLYKDDKSIATNLKVLSYVDEKPSPQNTYILTSVDQYGNESTGVKVTALYASPKISNLKAYAKDFRSVELSWKNPIREDFENVVIYRKDPNKTVLARIASFFNIGDDYKPLFETNGTTFKDLTVAADTQYTYRLNSTINGVEQSEAATVSIKTPLQQVVGGEGTKTEDGDYLYQWAAPTEGRVRVYVYNKEYKIVNAADKQILIPKNIIKYDAFNNPLIKLELIDEEGNSVGKITEGTALFNSGTTGTTSSVQLPENLTAANLLKAGVALAGVAGSFLLLSLAFKFAPRLFELIRHAATRRRGV